MEHITLSGHAGAFPLTAGARSALTAFLAQARTAVGNDPDGDETVRDLETSIGDRMRDILDGGATHVDDQAMKAILDETGPVRAAHTEQFAKVPWLCRVEEGKWFGGIFLGLATRSQLSADWVRTVAFFLLLLTGGLLGLIYLIALLFVPRVDTVEEYERMLAQQRSPHA